MQTVGASEQLMSAVEAAGLPLRAIFEGYAAWERFFARAPRDLRDVGVLIDRVAPTCDDMFFRYTLAGTRVTGQFLLLQVHGG